MRSNNEIIQQFVPCICRPEEFSDVGGLKEDLTMPIFGNCDRRRLLPRVKHASSVPKLRAMKSVLASICCNCLSQNLIVEIQPKQPLHCRCYSQ
ncbi:hypothetical protein CDAR_25671 [Caerostris darwini]|uniref:Uncharacterized protein n=1 Tax=Caerostris darwini TaxID=1538125 RepID=A0AAV4VST6_9ARAC|nr:hypothetical protein CDAR_25671 [Caerostris darwini]